MNYLKRSPSQYAFSLVEVTLALGIAGFCLLTIVGMLPVGLSSNKNSMEQSSAANLARAIAADLRTSSKTNLTSVQYGISYNQGSSTLYFNEDGTITNLPTKARYLATTVITTNTNSQAIVGIKITWPATVLPAAAIDSFETTTAIDRR